MVHAGFNDNRVIQQVTTVFNPQRLHLSPKPLPNLSKTAFCFRYNKKTCCVAKCLSLQTQWAAWFWVNGIWKIGGDGKLTGIPPFSPDHETFHMLAARMGFDFGFPVNRGTLWVIGFHTAHLKHNAKHFVGTTRENLDTVCARLKLLVDRYTAHEAPLEC